MIDRINHTVTSLSGTLDFLETASEVPELQQVTSDIANIILSSDIVGVTPYDLTLSKDNPRFVSHAFREDAGLLPAATYTFQAMPEDVAHFPDKLYDKMIMLYAVIHKSVGSAVSGNSVSDPGAFSGTRQPFVMLAHFDHPLTQSIAGIDAFSRVYGDVYCSLPYASRPDDPETPVVIGSSHLSAGKIALSMLRANDSCGDTTEWLESNTTAYLRWISREGACIETAPPKGTEIAEAYSFEPSTAELMRRYFVTAAMEAYAIEKGMPLESAAAALFRLLESTDH